MIYVSDERQGAIVLLPDLDGETWLTSVPSPALAVPPTPAGLAVTEDGRLAVADRSGSVILFMDRDGANAITLDPRGSPVGALKNPTGLAVGADGAIYVADTGNQRIVKATSIDAPTWSSYGMPGSSLPGEFLAPSAVAVDSSGRLLVTDPAAHRLVRFEDMNGLNWTELALGPGPVRPYGISRDPSGSLVTELSTRSVLRLHPDDSVTVAVDGTDELIAPIAAVMDGATIVVADAGAAQVSRWEDAGGTWKVVERLVGVPKALPGPQFTRIGGLAVA